MCSPKFCNHEVLLYSRELPSQKAHTKNPMGLPILKTSQRSKSETPHPKHESPKPQPALDPDGLQSP